MRPAFVILTIHTFICASAFSQAPQPTAIPQPFPTIKKDGKDIIVHPDTYIKHQLKGVKTKYKLIAVPDG